MKKISVIVPTFRRNRFILRALDSILSQDYSPKEIIVVDDNGEGTPDQLSTEEKLSSYIQNGLIRYIKNRENVGGAIARNIGIKASTGDYITFLDDDDIYLPGKLAAQAEAMEANGWDLCVMDGETYNEKNEKISHKIQPFDNGMSQQEILKAHITKHITGTNVFMYRREAIFKIGLFDQIPAGQEYMLMQKSITNDLKIGVIHEVMVHFHMDGQERISTKLSKIEGLNQIYREKKNYFSILSADERKEIKARHHGTLFYTYYTNKKYPKALAELIKAVFSSPQYTLAMYQERKGKFRS